MTQCNTANTPFALQACVCVFMHVFQQVFICLCVCLSSAFGEVWSSQCHQNHREWKESQVRIHHFLKTRALERALRAVNMFVRTRRKNWTSSWTVLQGSSLLFAKGQGGSTSWVCILQREPSLPVSSPSIHFFSFSIFLRVHLSSCHLCCKVYCFSPLLSEVVLPQ